MNAEKRLEERRELVERELERLLHRQESLLYQAMRYSVLGGGKRFRPLLCLSAAECLGAGRTLALPFACAVELIHDYSLIHDDLPSMDDDALRRGRPSCHKAFGEDIALLAGDGLLTMAFEVMAAAELPHRLQLQRAEIISEVARLAGVEGMIGGQLLDITFTAENATEKSLGELMLKKTGALIVASVRAGGLLGGAGPAQLGALTEFGENLGLAFQLRDDLADVAERGKKPESSNPNFALVYGADRARERLIECVDASVGALERASLRCPDLKLLAALPLK